MAMQFRNKRDTRRYAAAEDAFTSEGGYLALEDEGLEKNVDEARHPSHDFSRTMKRMRAVLTLFRGGSARPANLSAP